ncbi:DUF3857 domain-containing transglutaminase family protein [Pseudomonas costantinii]|uniref:Transglutaminase-like superfamily protein n=1 Tax=Pseudomonas costantinii TaxID=168469 RepID=A0A1S2UXB6_9PSED|nr:DUF3857 and transglutaminase domain-containing protein [Pseudomonas costantinii]NVZ22005.1 DUF3857 and transglutaminase domain-containing protein [Pseudomonas costantinii]OIN51077.1 hypothetical protein BFL40_16310 [Pseudomonas costantinii]SED89407.1 Transglutaminase-like superfamily protein [Pseudomonas costantinii]
MRAFQFLQVRRWCALVVAVGVFGTAQAKDDAADRSVTIEKNTQSFVINADGSYVLDADKVLLINEERAIRFIAQQSFSYNRSLDTLEIVEAFTQKPDGRKVMVGAEQIKEQQEWASANAPMFQDSRVKVVIFPEVAVGDRLSMRYKRTRKTALFPNEFTDFATTSLNPTERYSRTYDLPADKPLYADVRGFKASTAAAAPGRKVYRWDYVQAEKTRPEHSAVAYTDYGQFLAVSTFADYNGMAKAYDARAKTEVTPQITELAQKLTADQPTPRAKALALSDWVRKNIRYVAVYIEAGGVVPHSAQSVLDNLYGDCKDHVALLEALLKAVAIESSPALINYGNAYTLPTVAALGVINHAITYVPSLNLYLDSTASAIAPGYLPLLDLDKPVLLTRSGEMARTPATQPGKVSSELVFKIDEKGAADFTQTSIAEGWRTEATRFGVKSLPPTEREQLIQKTLRSHGQMGSGTLQTDVLEGDAPSFKTTLTGRTENLVNLPGPIGVQALSRLGNSIAQDVLVFSAEKERAQGFLCFASESVEKARFEFPSSVNILALPKTVSLKGTDVTYDASYERNGNAVLVSRTLKFSHPGAVCSPEWFKTMQPMIEAMFNDLKSQIIVQVI